MQSAPAFQFGGARSSAPPVPHNKQPLMPPKPLPMPGLPEGGNTLDDKLNPFWVPPRPGKAEQFRVPLFSDHGCVCSFCARSSFRNYFHTNVAYATFGKLHHQFSQNITSCSDCKMCECCRCTLCVCTVMAYCRLACHVGFQKSAASTLQATTNFGDT